MTAFPLNRPPPHVGTVPFNLLASPWALMLTLLLAWLFPPGPFTAAAFALVLVYVAMSPPMIVSAAIRLVLPFAAMAVWATVMGLGHDRYDLLKDLWYALKLCICVVLGFMIGIRVVDTRESFVAFTWFAIGSAVWSIISWRMIGAQSIDTIGLEGFAHLSLAAVIALPILISETMRQRGSRQVVSAGFACVLAFAVMISASRTTIISAAVMVIAGIGLFASWRRVVIAIALGSAAMYLIYLLLPTYSGGDLTLAVKFQRSLQEIFLTDSVDPQEMVLNWRGFEAYNAQLLFDKSSIIQKIFGNGFGTSVDLGIEIFNEDGGLTRFQPILHNGYYYILIKYGIAGIITYGGALLWYAMIGCRSQDALTQEDRLLRGVIGMVFFATLVVTGLYNKNALQDTTILLGWLIGQGCRFRFDRVIAGQQLVMPMSQSSRSDSLPTAASS